MSRMRASFAALMLVVGTACSGGINAGRQGGVAFIALTVMLLIGIGIMWFAMGRDE